MVKAEGGEDRATRRGCCFAKPNRKGKQKNKLLRDETDAETELSFGMVCQAIRYRRKRQPYRDESLLVGASTQPRWIERAGPYYAPVRERLCKSVA